VEPARVATFVNAADLVAIPSEREGFGLALLEALACNRAVLSTPTGIAPEALDGVAGTLCADWELETWIKAAEAAFASRGAIEGRERAAGWSSDACAEAVVEAWERALAQS
jgi:glycosyltransferase involved in cell wall biosynthesis